jgi:hypothetical protein
MPLLLLVAVLACWPRPAPAGLWSPETLAAYGPEAELEELRATRERITRHEALRRHLWRTAGELDREIASLRRRGERVRAELAAQDDRIRAQERALDRIVPRLLARLRALELRRGQAARALADLASLSRRQELDPELRGRLRAVGPVLLAVLRNRDVTSTALARQRDRLVEQQQRLAGRSCTPSSSACAPGMTTWSAGGIARCNGWPGWMPSWAGSGAPPQRSRAPCWSSRPPTGPGRSRMPRGRRGTGQGWCWSRMRCAAGQRARAAWRRPRARTRRGP